MTDPRADEWTCTPQDHQRIERLIRSDRPLSTDDAHRLLSEVGYFSRMANTAVGQASDNAARLAAAEAREARVRALLDDPGLMPYIRRKIRAALDA